MAAILIDTLFALGGLLALAAIWTTWRSHGRSALALRRTLRAFDDTQETRVRIVNVTATVQGNVLRPDFALRKAATLRPVTGLRAAA